MQCAAVVWRFQALTGNPSEKTMFVHSKRKLEDLRDAGVAQKKSFILCIDSLFIWWLTHAWSCLHWRRHWRFRGYNNTVTICMVSLFTVVIVKSEISLIDCTTPSRAICCFQQSRTICWLQLTEVTPISYNELSCYIQTCIIGSWWFFWKVTPWKLTWPSFFL